MIALLSAAFAAPLSLSYEEALSRALAGNPALRGADADVASAGGALLAARGPFDPSVSAGTSYFSSTNEGTGQLGNFYADTSGWSASVGLSQPLATGTTLGVSLESSQNRFLYRLVDTSLDPFTGDPQYSSSLAFTVSQALLEGNRLAWNLQGVRAAEGSLSVAEANRAAARQTALANVATAYWNVRTQAALVAIAEQTLTLSQEQFRVTRALVDAGRLASVEATRAEAAQVQAERAAIEARTAHAAAQDALLLLLGEMPGQEVEVRSEPEPPAALSLDATAVVERVLGHSPQLQAARAARDAARATAATARHGLLPGLAATGSWGVRGYESSLSASYGELARAELPEWSVGAELSVPLRNRKDRGALAQAAAAASAADIDVAALEASLAQQARVQVRTLEAAMRDISLAELNVRLAEETLAAERARLEEGRALQKDVLAAIKELDAARVQGARARAAWQDALVALRALEGAL